MNVNFLEFDAGWLWFILAAYGLVKYVYGSIFDQIRPAKGLIDGAKFGTNNVYGILGWSLVYVKRLSDYLHLIIHSQTF